MGSGVGAALVGAFLVTFSTIAAPAGAQTTVDGSCEIRSIQGEVTTDETTITLTNTRIEAAISELAIVRFHDLGWLVTGQNEIAGQLTATIAASETQERAQTTPPVEITGATTVTDPDGRFNTGDESATILVIATGLPDTTWSSLGPTQRFSVVGSELTVRLLFGRIDVDVPCRPLAGPLEFATSQTGTTTTTAGPTTTTTTAPSTTTTAAPTTTTAAPTTTTTTAGPTTTTAPVNQLPRTGPESAVGLALAGLILVNVGYLMFSATRP